MMRLEVDDGKLMAATVPLMLFIDFYSDIAFTIYLGFHPQSQQNSVLTTVAVVCIISSYLANIASMVTILLRVFEVRHF